MYKQTYNAYNTEVNACIHTYKNTYTNTYTHIHNVQTNILSIIPINIGFNWTPLLLYCLLSHLQCEHSWEVSAAH